MILVVTLFYWAVGKDNLTLSIQFVILEWAFFDCSVDEDLFALSVQLMSFEYPFLKRFLVYVNTEPIQTIFAIIIPYHLTCECPLFFLGMVNDPDTTYVNLLVEIWSVFYCYQFFYISNSELIFEF